MTEFTYLAYLDETGTDSVIQAGSRVFAINSNSAVDLRISGTTRWGVNGSGHFVPSANVTYQIGTSGLAASIVYTRNLISDSGQPLIIQPGGGLDQLQIFTSDSVRRWRMDSVGSLVRENVNAGALSMLIDSVDDQGIRITTGAARPMLQFTSPAFGGNIATIFQDGGGAATGANQAVVIRSVGPGGVYLPVGAVAWVAISDRREKKNISPLEYGLNELKQIQPVRFDYKNDLEEIEDYDDTQKKIVKRKKRQAARIGVIAQDVLAVAPEAVSGVEERKLGVAMTDLIPILINAIKELSSHVEANDRRIDALSTALNSLLPNAQPNSGDSGGGNGDSSRNQTATSSNAKPDPISPPDLD